MSTNVKEHLLSCIAKRGLALESSALQLPDATLDPSSIRVLMISEAPPADPCDGFYSAAPNPADLRTALSLLGMGGLRADDIAGVLARGIYLTTAIKTPKTAYAVDEETLSAHLPLLESELDLFPGLRIVMLMGDVAKKAFNRIAKSRTGRNAIPSGATYKIRGQQFTSMGFRVFPSYIITGGNLLIEKGKCDMIAEDIRRMMELLPGET